MRMTATFQNGHMRVQIIADDDFEKRLLGVFAHGEKMKTEATISCDTAGHWSNGKINQVMITFARVNHE